LLFLNSSFNGNNSAWFPFVSRWRWLSSLGNIFFAFVLSIPSGVSAISFVILAPSPGWICFVTSSTESSRKLIDNHLIIDTTSLITLYALLVGIFKNVSGTSNERTMEMNPGTMRCGAFNGKHYQIKRVDNSFFRIL
jgi:hypothetical protein